MKTLHKGLTNIALFYGSRCMHPYCRYTSSCDRSDVFCTNDDRRDDLLYSLSSGFNCSGLYPPSKRWILPWYYIGIGGTIILIILYLLALPGSGYPINPLDVADRNVPNCLCNPKRHDNFQTQKYCKSERKK